MIDLVLKIARNEVGVRETETDWGPRIKIYLASVGIFEPAHWCAAFVYFCIAKAAKEKNLEAVPCVRTAWTPTFDEWAKENKILFTTPKTGDIFVLRDSISAFHMGFVASVTGATFGTIEGNTNIDGSANGIGVFDRARTNNGNYGFIRWADLLPNERTYDLMDGSQLIQTMPVYHGRAYAKVRDFANHFRINVSWNQVDQLILFNGIPVNTRFFVEDGSAWAPVRDLVEAAGLRLFVQGTKVEVLR